MWRMIYSLKGNPQNSHLWSKIFFSIPVKTLHQRNNYIHFEYHRIVYCFVMVNVTPCLKVYLWCWWYSGEHSYLLCLWCFPKQYVHNINIYFARSMSFPVSVFHGIPLCDYATLCYNLGVCAHVYMLRGICVSEFILMYLHEEIQW